MAASITGNYEVGNMVEFRVPRQALEDVATSSDESGAADQEVTEFEVSDKVMHDLGQAAGNVSVAAELITESAAAEPKPKRSVSEPSEEEIRRAARNFSFIDGETQQTYRRISSLKCMKADTLRSAMGFRYNDEENGIIVNRQSIGLLSTGIGTYYVAHLGTPLPGPPPEDMGSLSTIDQGSFAVENLADTSVFIPKLLKVGMGKSEEFWVAALPPLSPKGTPHDEIKFWSPAVKI